MMTFRMVYQVLLITIIVTSCGIPHTSQPTGEITSRPQSFPPGIPLELKPIGEQPMETMIEFLIDNSDSVKDECPATGVRRYDFVNFILKIFHTIPEQISKKISVGVSSFGNPNYSSIIPIKSFDNTFQEVSDPGSFGNDQSFVDGIEQATEEMNNIFSHKKVLIIITDGKLFKEDMISIQKKLLAKSSSNNLSFIIALCNTTYSADWNIIANQNINVATFEDTARYLFTNSLKEFLPNTIVVTTSNYQLPLPVAGYFTSARFAYWNSDYLSSSILITNGATGDPWDIASNLISPPYAFRSYDGCPIHNLTIPPLSSHELLVIQPQSFHDLILTVKTLNEGLVEVINNIPINLEFEVTYDTQSDINLAEWPDCFLIGLFDQNSNLLTNPTNDSPLITEKLLANIDNEILYGEITWIPGQSQSPRDFPIKVRLGTLINNSYIPLWETELYNIPMRFRASYIYDPPQPTYTPLTPVKDDDREISLMFRFSNVASKPRIYLVTAFDEDTLRAEEKEKGWGNLPLLDIPVNDNQQAFLINQLSHDCQPSQSASAGQIFACIKLGTNQNQPNLEYLLYQEYVLRAYDYLISGYKFNQLFFVWTEDANTKEQIWRCDLGQPINCTDNVEFKIK